jgi:hypothetical protein
MCIFSFRISIKGEKMSLGSFLNKNCKETKRVYPHKTPILPLSFATCAISLVPGTWDISRFESVRTL